MPATTLYEISEHLLALLDTIDLAATEEERLECAAEIYRAVEAQVRKVDDFARFLAHLESQAAFASQEIERLKHRRDRFAHHEQRLEQYAVQVMQSLELRRLDGQTARLSLRTNQPAVAIDNDLILPEAYRTIVQEIRPNKRLIKQAIEQGQTVPGAHLLEPSVSLIRT